jgi:hypothetical protein
MNLIIDSSLCAPPSDVSVFRDVTLYGKIFIFDDVLVQCERGTRSCYWDWLKSFGAHDIVSYMICDNEKEHGFKLSPQKGNLNVDSINAFNLNFIIAALNSAKGVR